MLEKHNFIKTLNGLLINDVQDTTVSLRILTSVTTSAIGDPRPKIGGYFKQAVSKTEIARGRDGLMRCRNGVVAGRMRRSRAYPSYRKVERLEFSQGSHSKGTEFAFLRQRATCLTSSFPSRHIKGRLRAGLCLLDINSKPP